MDNISNQKSYLELQVVWKDDHMFELKVTTSNGRYFGITEVYDTSESLASFAKSLLGYPKDEKALFYDVGQTDGYSYFSMRFYCIDNAGHIGVQINLEENVPTDYRQEEKHKLKLEIKVEPNSIDNFQRELLQLAIKQEGVARLYGRDN